MEKNKTEVPNEEASEKTIYYTMKMPDWFMDLDDEEKVRLAKKMAKIPEDIKPLSPEQIAALMPSSVE